MNIIIIAIPAALVTIALMVQWTFSRPRSEWKVMDFVYLTIAIALIVGLFYGAFF